jgi:hypothetical protein
VDATSRRCREASFEERTVVAHKPYFRMRSKHHFDGLSTKEGRLINPLPDRVDCRWIKSGSGRPISPADPAY